MNQKTIVLTFILFALIVIGMFIFARIRHAEISEVLSSIFTV
jgi:hypothetical protein